MMVNIMRNLPREKLFIFNKLFVEFVELGKLLIHCHKRFFIAIALYLGVVFLIKAMRFT